MARNPKITAFILISGFLMVLGLSVDCPISKCYMCSLGVCYSCYENYQLRNNSCIPICDQYCTTCASPGNCTACISTAKINISTNKCELNCSLGFKGRCKICSNFYLCKECNQEYFLTDYNRVCTAVNQNCSLPNCLKCTDNNTCNTCVTGYKIQTTKDNTTNITSSACTRDICYIPYCLVCSSISTCNTCAKNYALALSSTACSPSCGVTKCLICSSSTVCDLCEVGYSLANNNCIVLCTIANCSICLTQSTCQNCLDGYSLSKDGKSCDISCNDIFCLNCLSSKSCSFCQFGYTLSGSKCRKNCSIGYASNIHNVCLSCSSKANCSDCYYDSSDTLICSKCQFGYYVSSYSCSPCSESLANCSSCVLSNGSPFCLLCSQGYAVNSSGICIQKNCSVANCQNCQTDNATKCLNCSAGFTTDSDGTICVIDCKNGQLLINGVCSCPVGTYQSGSSCSACSDSNCLSCTANICNSCINGYYLSGSTCYTCISDCLLCLDSSTCLVCYANYVYYGSSCTYFGNGFSGVSEAVGKVYTCPAGCDSCSLGINDILVCTVMTPGYSFYRGIIIKCKDSCLSCATSDICLSCYPGSVLVGTACSKCSDSNAYSCMSTNLNLSLSCISGFTLVYNGSINNCQSCASNCIKCDVNGAGYCDYGQCYRGYVQLLGTKNCTPCFLNCPQCDSRDPLICLSCGQNRYQNFKGLCLACPTGCKNCSDKITCSSCLVGYILISSLCYISPGWPCALGSNGNCTLCVQGYRLLSSGKCTYNSTCGTKCFNCVYGYYLVTSQAFSYGNCSICPIISNCLSCDPSNTSKCLICNDGFYVSSGKCQSCPDGCLQCSSPYFCSQAKQGKYLQKDNYGLYTGLTNSCTSPCSTCNANPKFCLTCITGYIINGSACFSGKTLYYQMLFELSSMFDSNDNFSVAYGKVLNNIGYLQKMICSNLPQRVKGGNLTCQNYLNFLSFKSGSISFVAAINAANYSTLSEASADISSKTLINDAKVLKTSITSSGIYDQTPLTSYEYKASLVLAIVIPISIVIIIVIITICYYNSKKPTALINFEPKDGKYSQASSQNIIR